MRSLRRERESRVLGVRAVVFDLDGTLVDTMTSAPEAYIDTVRVLGGPALSVSDVTAAWHVGPTPVVLAHFLARPVSSDDLNCFYEHFEAAMATVQPFAGVDEMLHDLSLARYSLGVFTTATKRAATLMLKTARLDVHFTTVVGGDEVSHAKPATDGLRLACRRLGLASHEAAYVGDADVDLRCAETTGSLAIHAAWNAPAVRLAGNHAVARHPRDVVTLIIEANRTMNIEGTP